MSKYRYYITPEEYDIAENNGIPKNEVDRRVRKRGWKVEEAITKPIRGKRTISNEIKEILIKNKIPIKYYYQRLNIGWSHERAISTPVLTMKECAKLGNIARNTRPLKLTLEDKEILKEMGLYPRLAYDRMKRGWSKEKALTTPKIKITSKINARFIEDNYFVFKLYNKK